MPVTTAAPRRELLLTAAAELFAARGFHAVGIDDIGAAAGITGPGVYRHFSSKQALLEQLCERTMTRMLALAQATDDLDGLVDLHVTFAVEQRAMLSVWVREQRALSDEVRRALRLRMGAYDKVWGDALTPLRTDLDVDEVDLTVRSTLALLNTTSLIDSPLPDDRRVAQLRRIALAALLSP